MGKYEAFTPGGPFFPDVPGTSLDPQELHIKLTTRCQWSAQTLAVSQVTSPKSLQTDGCSLGLSTHSTEIIMPTST
jgi:hypothetical protein